MKTVKKLADKKYFMTIVWIVLIMAVWEIFAFYVAATKRTPENILPHLSGIAESVVSKRTINGGQTAVQMVMTNASATLSRAAIGYIIGIVCGFVLALLMSLWKPIEKNCVSVPYADTNDTDPGNGTYYQRHYGRYNTQPRRNRRDTHVLSRGNKYPRRV